VAKPFLKWAGGKRQLLPEIQERLPSQIHQFTTYIEPFVGGGAVLFHLLDRYQFEKVYIIDINPELTLCYERIRDDVDGVIAELEKLITAYPKTQKKREPAFKKLRIKWNKGVNQRDTMSSAQQSVRVAQMIFLNRTCFNGLFRVNQAGEFNVPIGGYVNPSFPSSDDLQAASTALQNVEVHHGSYEDCLEWVDHRTFLYLDPPYRPLSSTSAFTSYSKEDFDDEDQKNLASFIRDLTKKGASLMLSNSDSLDSEGNSFFDSIYNADGHHFVIERVLVSRAINSDPTKRGRVSEILVSNLITNREVTNHLSGLMVPDVRYTARELSDQLRHNVRLHPQDLEPMDSEKQSRYRRMVTNAVRHSPDFTSYGGNSWGELKIDKEASTSSRNRYYLEIEQTGPFHRHLKDGAKILFGRGRFDDWCVYIQKDGKRRAPLDTEYFEYLRLLGNEIGAEKVYADFVELWTMAAKEPNPSANALIDRLISSHPDRYQLRSEKWYTVLYMAMISEEHWPGTRLGKRIKRLGVHQILIENMPPEEAAHWSRGRRWFELDNKCKNRGF
jgi:DNA adenine methylase